MICGDGPEPRQKLSSLEGFCFLTCIIRRIFSPEDVYGLFGYLDDAYFAGAVYTQVVEEIRGKGIRLAKFDEDLNTDIKRLSKAVKIVIPKEVEKIDRLIHEATHGNYDTYLRMFSSLRTLV